MIHVNQVGVALDRMLAWEIGEPPSQTVSNSKETINAVGLESSKKLKDPKKSLHMIYLNKGLVRKKSASPPNEIDNSTKHHENKNLKTFPNVQIHTFDEIY